jgi:hypothetical protein
VVAAERLAQEIPGFMERWKDTAAGLPE